MFFLPLRGLAHISIENTSLYCLLSHTQQILATSVPLTLKKDALQTELKKTEQLKTAVEKAIALQGEIFTVFSSQTTFYNPELAHTFYTTCTLLDEVSHAEAFQPRHIRSLRDNAVDGAKYFTSYLASRTMFLNKDDRDFLQSIITFYQLLCGIYSDEYRMFGLAERIADYFIHRPWKFICENPGVGILVGAIVGYALWRWIEKTNQEYEASQVLARRISDAKKYAPEDKEFLDRHCKTVAEEKKEKSSDEIKAIDDRELYQGTWFRCAQLAERKDDLVSPELFQGIQAATSNGKQPEDLQLSRLLSSLD